MDRWFHEDWRFRIEVVKVGKNDETEECRLGLERGGIFECAYDTPAGFCPTSFMKIFPAMEAVRCGGDLRNLGGEDKAKTVFSCPDGVAVFRLTGARQASES